MNNLSKIIHLSPPNLAYFAPWRESIPLFEYFNSNGKFAQAAQILKDSSAKHTKGLGDISDSLTGGTEDAEEENS